MSDAKIRAAVEALVSALVDAARAPQPAPTAEYLTTAGAAQLASVNEGTIRRWVRAASSAATGPGGSCAFAATSWTGCLRRGGA